MNENNRNGKVVHRGQMPDNIQKEGNVKPVNRIRKKNTAAEKDIPTGEPKKIPLNINKNTGNAPKRRNKGHVIKLEDKGPGNHPVENPSVENRRPNPRPQNYSNNRNTISKEPPVYKVNTESKEIVQTQKGSFTLSGNAGKWLLAAAVILFVAWAIIFFYYKIGGNSHMLLALAVIGAIVSLVGSKK